MRTPIIAGNWKMHKTIAEAVLLARQIREAVADVEGVDVVLCTPFTALSAVEDVITDSKVGLGAQNMHFEDQGAFTGEVSPLMLKGWCDYVIIGHSERRQYFAETDEGVNKKIKAALKHHIIPIVCVGENLDQNEAGETVSFVGGQVKAAFVGLSADDAVKVVVAYEPIWAIGTGKTAQPEDANRIIKEAVRSVLAGIYGDDVAQKIRIQYGGSVNPGNIEAIMSQPEIDGALVGGASLKADSFETLVKGALVKYK